MDHRNPAPVADSASAMAAAGSAFLEVICLMALFSLGCAWIFQVSEAPPSTTSVWPVGGTGNESGFIDEF
jgi:hypothetical protein